MTTDAAPRRRAALPVWLVATVSAFFGLFYAYAVWAAVGFLISQASGPLGLNGYGWFVLILAVVFPAIAFAIAFAIGWRRRLLPFAAILLTGLGVTAVFWVNVLGYAAAYGAQLLGS
ncbi:MULTISPECIES: hypothetical protein [Microbacterium]|jgi:hypothetical protein|uniref:hypothetical protein n=1 Tax=Microbacterium TaxID=33882 RepID=UPI0006FF7F48|nr:MULTISPECIES: hypothetical protein [unclassified Microbacterium]MBN9197113.1 bacitracin resistance protein [Microbacterium ginsengisoli]MCK9916894.1 bacitracin resistance protein [Microbacteriaceae bacterium K1510]KQR91221.1 bacitracin resistance protein [Microbacterium sp. Leaf347]KQS01219.1 bacitracin resistance protein [Microbacterium sp. Leaf351]ODU77445.1 MAG: bacitracin resistance protein [Microbacterium sp. SCN 71-21]